jgi:hypothetical protein
MQKVTHICVSRGSLTPFATGSGQKTSDTSLNASSNASSSSKNQKTHLKDPTKPGGDACREDGTLKDATEMIWLNSPSEVEAFGSQDNEVYDTGMISELDESDLPKAMSKVSEKLTISISS